MKYSPEHRALLAYAVELLHKKECVVERSEILDHFSVTMATLLDAVHGHDEIQMVDVILVTQSESVNTILVPSASILLKLFKATRIDFRSRAFLAFVLKAISRFVSTIRAVSPPNLVLLWDTTT
jgi:hypothetical protein